MARSSMLVSMDIAALQASNAANQNAVTEYSAKLQQLQDKIDELDGKKTILESTQFIYGELKTYIEGHLASLDETSVCITEIKTEATEQIGGKIDIALSALERLIGQIKSDLLNANTEYDTTYGQLQICKSNLSTGQQRLGTLQTELEQAKAEELMQM